MSALRVRVIHQHHHTSPTVDYSCRRAPSPFTVTMTTCEKVARLQKMGAKTCVCCLDFVNLAAALSRASQPTHACYSKILHLQQFLVN
jgi:hypothetical protein